MAPSKVKVGVVGVGKMGAFHLQKYLADPSVEVVGIYEHNETHARGMGEKFGVRIFQSLTELLFETDAVTIASPTPTHYAIARQAFESGVNVLIEKPMTTFVREAEELVALAKSRDLILQVGFVERFRYRALTKDLDSAPVRYIEARRFNLAIGRESDIDVVTDLMIHDLDLALSLVPEEPKVISAIGTSVINEKEDIANARLEFPNGTIINLSASRISSSPERKFQVFTPRYFASVNFLTNQTDVYLKGEDKKIEHRQSQISAIDALEEQARHFIRCVRGESRCLAPGYEGLRALRVAESIKESMQKRFERADGPDSPNVDVQPGVEH